MIAAGLALFHAALDPINAAIGPLPVLLALIDIYIYRPVDAKPGRPVLVYLHGGGFTAGDMRLYANQMKLIAEKSGAVVVLYPSRDRCR